LIGARQEGREIDRHVTPAKLVATDIVDAIRAQLVHGRYQPSTLYGDGYVSERIAKALACLTPYVQKHLHYIYEKENGNDDTSEQFPAAELRVDIAGISNRQFLD
jgi:hypothetical protein